MFENLLNFRDLGGHTTVDGARVRPGLLYRSESVAYLSDADTAVLVDELGLATVVDLRGEREVAVLGRGPLERRAVRYVHVPVTDVTRGMASMAGFYVGMLEQRGDAVAGILRALLEPGALPVLVHCEAGCDRTGVVAAAALGVLGVPDDDIVADYDLTQAAFPAMNERWKAYHLSRGRPIERWVEETWTERERAMAETLSVVRGRWGGWAAWADTYGFTAEERERLRKLLVE